MVYAWLRANLLFRLMHVWIKIDTVECRVDIFGFSTPVINLSLKSAELNWMKLITQSPSLMELSIQPLSQRWSPRGRPWPRRSSLWPWPRRSSLWPWPRSLKSSKTGLSSARGQHFLLNCYEKVFGRRFFLEIAWKIFVKTFFGEHLRLCPLSLASAWNSWYSVK